MKQRRARPVFASSRRLSRKRRGSIFRFRPFSHASSRRLSRKRLGSIEKAVLSPPTGPLAGTQEAVLSPPTGPLATGPLAGAQEAVLSPPTGPLAGRHLFRVISFATAFHNLIRDPNNLWDVHSRGSDVHRTHSSTGCAEEGPFEGSGCRQNLTTSPGFREGPMKAMEAQMQSPT